MHTICSAQPPRDYPVSWGEWLRAGLRLMDRDLLRVIDRLSAMAERCRQRRALLRFDDAVLKDIGLSRADAWREASKPAWKD
jgi:uncharacterized protein YjiS (DUF1127 family)